MRGSADRALAFAAVAVAAVMLFAGLGSAPLMWPDEGRNAEVAREMAAGSSWLTPTLEGNPYLDKPAAYFALVAVSLSVFGVNEWGARIPSALCGAAILAVVYVFAAKQYDRTTAWLAVVVVATSPLVFAFSRIVIMDGLLAALTISAIFLGFAAEDRAVPGRRLHAWGALCAGLGVLVKGPVGVLVPAAVFGVFFWVDGRAAALRRVFAPVNIAIVFAVVLPWFAALVHAHPEFARYGLVEETAQRFFTPSFNRGGPFWYFGPALAASLLPWTILAVPLAFAAWPARDRFSAADRLLMVSVVVVVVFFSLSRTKQPGYILTAVVAAGMLVARGLGYAWRNPGGRSARLTARGSLALAMLAIALAVALGWAVAHGAADDARLAAARPEARPIWQSWATFLTVLLAVGLAGGLAFFRRSVGLAVTAFVLFPLALVTAAFPAYAGFARVRSAKPLAEALAAVPPEVELACFETYPAGLSFYLGRTVSVISENGKPLRSNFILYQMKRKAARPATLVDPGQRDQWLASPAPALILARDESKQDLHAWLGGAQMAVVIPGWWSVALPRSGAR